MQLQVLSMVDNVTLSWKPGFNGYSELSTCTIQVSLSHMPRPTHKINHQVLKVVSALLVSSAVDAFSQEGGASSAEGSGSSSSAGSLGYKQSLQLQCSGVLCQRGGGVSLFALVAIPDT